MTEDVSLCAALNEVPQKVDMLDPLMDPLLDEIIVDTSTAIPVTEALAQLEVPPPKSPDQLLVEALNHMIGEQIENLKVHLIGTVEDIIQDKLYDAIEYAMDDRKFSRMLENAVSGELDNFDFSNNYGFERAVESAVEDFDFDGAVRNVISELTFTVTVD